LVAWSAGRRVTIRRALSANIDSVGRDGGDDEEFQKRIQELAAEQHPGAGGWRASSVSLPLSLRMLKRRKQHLDRGGSRWDDAGESARAAVSRAFSSMVLMIRELQSFTLRMREALLYEDTQAVLARAHAEMHASFVWLFQHIFADTPALMVSLMLLLANFTVYSMGASAATLPPPHPTVAVVDTQQPEQSSQRSDAADLKTTFSVGRTASVGGNGGGTVRPVAGATGDGHSDESASYWQSGTVSPQDVSQSQSTPMGVEASVSDSMAVEETAQTEDELVVWKRISDEAARMQASARAEELMDPEILGQLVAPVAETVEYSPEFAVAAQRYEEAVSEEPNNSLLLGNFAQFLYLVQHDHDR
jgi:hypothetical protein